MNKILREVQDTPDSLVEKGILNVGTFESHFEEFNFLNRKRPVFKKFINKNLLTEWQAIEVLAEDIFVICAVFKFGVMNRTLFFVYEIKENILHNYSSVSFFKTKAKVAPFLHNMSVSVRKTKNTFIKITNNLNDEQLFLEGYGNKEEKVDFKLSFKRIAKPSVVSLPLTKKHTVYTEKDFLEPKGYITFKDKTHTVNDSDVSIFDDHRGYYPLSSGYDWVTCMGKVIIDNKESKFGINLTYFYKNNKPTLFNENGYWIDSKYYQLPSVMFNRDGNSWNIFDKGNRVKLVFSQKNQYSEKNMKGIKIDYVLAFGTLSGEIITFDNKKILIDEIFSLGEKRITQFLNCNTHNKGG